ncbi:ribosomal L7Ae/L30e/S12e/Gadd45 family protein [Candidatus Woesearchaeota archaeon]|nr:ribosomal L7Ae/L30e/S12e/Gadd45 family protein [Candidatus Woesearchaeota archaeon]
MSLDKLKQILKDKNKLTLGADETVKKIKQGKVQTIFIAKDCKPLTRDTLLSYKKKGDLEIFELDINSAEIGILCKKQFLISVLSC